MIIRKPTKIELKPEDDFYEYEEFKKKQQEMAKKPILDSKQSSKLPDKMLIESNSNPFKMSMANEIFKTPNVGMTVPHNLNPSLQVPNTSNNQFESFNLVRSQVANPDFDMSSIRNDSPHINQLFSLLLNNLNSGGQNFSNIYSSGNGNSDNTNNQSNNNNLGLMSKDPNDFPDEQFKKYYRHLEKVDHKNMSSFFPKVFVDYPKCPLFIFKYSQMLYQKKEFENSFAAITKALEIYSENLANNRSYLNKSFDGDLKYQLFLLRINVLDKLGTTSQDIKKALLDLKEESERNPSESREEVNTIIQKYSEKYKLNGIKPPQTQHRRSFEKSHQQEVNSEAKEVFDLMEASNDQNFMKEEGFPVNIISMNWFIKWKKYSYFHVISGERFDECSSIELSQSSDREHPGPINQDDILLKEPILIDPDTIKNYCNTILKPGIEENKDFLIVSHKVWKFLFRIYGGQEIKRYIVSVNDDSNITHVELNLKKINVIMWPPVNKQEITQDILYLSKKEAIKDLKEKLFRIYHLKFRLDPSLKSPGNSRIWKAESRIPIEELIDSMRCFTETTRNPKKQFIFKGRKIEDSTPLEESEISELDHVIIEYKINEDWIITSEEKAQAGLKSQCAYCHASNKPLYYCECRQLKYCDMNCLKAHRSEHKDSCLKAKKEINNTNDMLRHFGINVNKKFTKDSKKGITGLQNLGNTCFMNSALQCLSNTAELTQYFLSNEFLKDLNKNNPLGTGGYLISAYSELIKELWMGSDSYVSPWDLKKVIGKFAPQFSGYSQQDSQELLSYLLDGLHEDLNRVLKKPFVEDIEYKNQRDEELSMESWSNYLKRNQSIIVDLFSGQYKSKLDCPDCKKISITFDPFLSISLPVPHLITTTTNFFFIPKDSTKIPYKMSATLPSEQNFDDLLDYIEKSLNINKENMTIAIMKDHVIIDYINSAKKLKDLEDSDKGTILVYELGSMKPSEQYLKIETIIHQARKKGEDNKDVSYSRLFRISIDTSFESIVLQIYKFFRVFIKNFIKACEEKLPAEFDIDLENDDYKTLKAEYSAMFFNKNFDPPYLLYYLKNEEKVEIPYEKGKSFAKMVEDIDDKEIIIEFNLVFANYIKIDDLKINRCQEPPFEDKPKELSKSSIYDCLNLFTKEEVLDVENAWYCSNCKSHKQAKKKMEIYKTPKILILHLKRFKTSKINSIGTYYYTSGSSKITNVVDFPINGLNLNSYVRGQGSAIYDLFAVSNHYGGLYGGHYTATCQNYMDEKWYEFNDSSTEEVDDPRKIISEAAYVLFYKRREESNAERQQH